MSAGLLRRRILILSNPGAGRSRSARRRLGQLAAALERRGCAVVLREGGAEIGGVERLARDAEPEFDAIVAAGGDGTLNAVANGSAAGVPRPIALLALGTANVLAHELGLPRHLERLAELIADAPGRLIWPGCVGDRLFLTMASAGFDAAVVAAVNPMLKRLIGRAAFVWAILAELCHYRAGELVIHADEAEYRAATVIAARGRCYAGAYVVAPQADRAEPTLVLVLLRRSGRLAVLRYLLALLTGRLAGHRDVSLVRCRAAMISAIGRVPVQADGEVVGCLPVSIRVADRPLVLIQP